MGTPALVCRPPASAVDITRSHCHPPSPRLHRFHRFHLRRAPLSAWPSSSSSPSPAEDSRPPHVPSGPSASQPRSPSPSSDPPPPSPKQDNNVDVEAQPQRQTAAQSAFEKAMAYKKMKSNPNRVVPPSSASSSSPSQPQTPTLPSSPVPPEVKIPADTPSSQLRTSSPPDDASANPDLNVVSPSEEENVVEIEIHTRDGIVRRKMLKPETAFANVKDLKRKGVSTLDFVGLGFADKKPSTGRPAGLREAFEAPSGPLPEVEVLTRDAGVADPEAMVEGGDVYKPKVTTWGMFPRPADISKAYGGGRTIKPGQKLETEEEKIARETKTKKLLSEYKKKFGLDMAPKDRVRCEKNMKNGEDLMDRGQLREAQAAFITVKDEMPFPSELHGMAALQEAVCLESLNRSDEAKIQYEKLLSHPNGAVRKKARQLLFGFQAAEKLKVRAGYNWDSSSYRKYFDAFADGYNTMYTKSEEEKKKEKEEEEAFMQNLRFALLLLVPVILVVTLVATKS